MATGEQLSRISAQDQIIGQIVRGLLDPKAVKEALDKIIESAPVALNCSRLSWWHAPEQQLERARQLWPGLALPEPLEFTPRTKSEVLLLHVPDTFDSLWDKAVAPPGYAKYRWEGIKTGHMRLAPGKAEYAQPTWLVFDPEHGRGERPDSFWGQADIAASEIFSALIQFPDWISTWHDGASAPNLAGYQLKYNEGWVGVPSIYLCGTRRSLELDGIWGDDRYANWASPTVRGC